MAMLKLQMAITIVAIVAKMAILGNGHMDYQHGLTVYPVQKH